MLSLVRSCRWSSVRVVFSSVNEETETEKLAAMPSDAILTEVQCDTPPRKPINQPTYNRLQFTRITEKTKTIDRSPNLQATQPTQPPPETWIIKSATRAQTSAVKNVVLINLRSICFVKINQMHTSVECTMVCYPLAPNADCLNNCWRTKAT